MPAVSARNTQQSTTVFVKNNVHFESRTASCPIIQYENSNSPSETTPTPTRHQHPPTRQEPPCVERSHSTYCIVRVRYRTAGHVGETYPGGRQHTITSDASQHDTTRATYRASRLPNTTINLSLNKKHSPEPEHEAARDTFAVRYNIVPPLPMASFFSRTPEHEHEHARPATATITMSPLSTVSTGSTTQPLTSRSALARSDRSSGRKRNDEASA